ncbi:hypothetical protein NADFUDRAFT_82099 [Nadsonia fulvescens var. elongata DSM 6958]|uniref:Zn(2)-C6 fungal-type domain-containing protein n=1 Tax=Nadsonia fulvescens var. elongata DSM 6958 TaxID=857566 RepID=A0A1E3PLM4_9ASCO|nr:hypothetical protein NADFUDRAFT_82099 [Nadsonia fulvescens var. elongata DSM 6958]
MPDGAKAWKLINPPGSQTARIAQACDRCRAKKIRCDGQRPHCSQCLAVGFECRTSDKLSRRAYPRGYTESLEDRVRALEADNDKLLNLLDIKDEQMELLSKVDAMSGAKPVPAPASLASPDSLSSLTPSLPSQDPDEEPYVVRQIVRLTPKGTYKASTTGGAFVDVFKDRIHRKYPSVVPLLENVFLHMNNRPPAPAKSTTHPEDIPPTPSPKHAPQVTQPQQQNLYAPLSPASTIVNDSPSSPTFPSANFFASLDLPARVTCDQLVNTYFQEWHCMYPILDQCVFLKQYQSLNQILSHLESATPVPESLMTVFENRELFAINLLLVLALGSLSSKDLKTQTEGCWRLELEWQRRLSLELATAPSLATLQALSLAQLYSMHTGNVDQIWQFRMLTVNMCQRMGCHRCHKSLSTYDGKPLNLYDQELRRRLFWVVLVLDTFASAVLGAPRLLNDKDLECVLPSKSSTPDNTLIIEDVSQVAISVMTFAKILATIIDTVYAATTSHHTYRTIIKLEDSLETWRRELSPDLKFEFVHGMPTTTALHQKSPLLYLMYHYARILIHLPAIHSDTNSPSVSTTSGSSASTPTSTRGSASCIAVMQSAKQYTQVASYLRQRNVVATLPLNASRIAILMGFILLQGSTDYTRGGSLQQEIRKLMTKVLDGVYTDMRHHLPGAITSPIFQAFEEMCDTLLSSSAAGVSSTSPTLANTAESAQPNLILSSRSTSTSRSRTRKASSSVGSQNGPLLAPKSATPTMAPKNCTCCTSTAQPQRQSSDSSKASATLNTSLRKPITLAAKPTVNQKQPVQSDNAIDDLLYLNSLSVNCPQQQHLLSQNQPSPDQMPLHLHSFLDLLPDTVHDVSETTAAFPISPGFTGGITMDEFLDLHPEETTPNSTNASVHIIGNEHGINDYIKLENTTSSIISALNNTTDLAIKLEPVDDNIALQSFMKQVDNGGSLGINAALLDINWKEWGLDS